MRIVWKIFRYVFMLLVVLLLVVNVSIIVQRVMNNEEMPLIFGFGNATVITGSMEPAVNVGDMVIIQEQESYQVENIVLYKADSFITHRVVEVTEDGYITQGDANNVADEEIQASQVVGKVVQIIPKVGFLTDFLKSPFGMLILITALVLMIEIPAFLERRSKRR